MQTCDATIADLQAKWRQSDASLEACTRAQQTAQTLATIDRHAHEDLQAAYDQMQASLQTCNSERGQADAAAALDRHISELTIARLQASLDTCNTQAAGVPPTTATAAAPPPDTTKVQGRYVRVQRVDGEARQLALGALFASSGILSWQPITGSVFPLYQNNETEHGWRKLTDNSNETFASTEPNAAAYIELDYGVDIPIDKLEVHNAPFGYVDPLDLHGCEVRILADESRSVVWSEQFPAGSPLNTYVFWPLVITA